MYVSHEFDGDNGLQRDVFMQHSIQSLDDCESMPTTDGGTTAVESPRDLVSFEHKQQHTVNVNLETVTAPGPYLQLFRRPEATCESCAGSNCVVRPL